MARQFAVTVDMSITAIEKVVIQARSRDELYELLPKLLNTTHAPALARIRLQRAKLAGATMENPRFRRVLSQQQDRLTQAMIDLFRTLQERDWVKSEIDPHAAAVLVQAYSLGLVVDDVASKRLRPGAWNDLIGRLLILVFRP